MIDNRLIFFCFLLFLGSACASSASENEVISRDVDNRIIVTLEDIVRDDAGLLDKLHLQFKNITGDSVYQLRFDDRSTNIGMIFDQDRVGELNPHISRIPNDSDLNRLRSPVLIRILPGQTTDYYITFKDHIEDLEFEGRDTVSLGVMFMISYYAEEADLEIDERIGAIPIIHTISNISVVDRRPRSL